jgi:hypothetical protein
MNCTICNDPAQDNSEFCGWCNERINQFIVGNKNHSTINITWGCGRIGWQDAYYFKSLIDDYGIKDVLEFGTGLSTEIWDLFGVNVVSCDTLENHLNLFKNHATLKDRVDFHYYKQYTLPDFKTLYPGKTWDLVFVDGGQSRDLETEISRDLSHNLILLHDPGLSKFKLDLGEGWEQQGGSYLFKKI